jgi:hypothetical protein
MLREKLSGSMPCSSLELCASSVLGEATIDNNVVIDLLNRIDKTYPRIRKGLFIRRNRLILKIPNYTHETPHARFTMGSHKAWHLVGVEQD